MKVFISWSGQKSKETAEILSSWIRQVIQAAETWISLDIEKGARWNDKINNELEQTKIGIICLNKENLTSEWILFEAGALSKTQDAHVCTFLLDVNPADVKPPLGQFQHTSFSKDDIRKLMHTINNKIISSNEKTLPEKDLDEVFEVFWKKLESKLQKLKNVQAITKVIKRTDRDILEEILQVVRSNSKNEIIATFFPGISNENDDLSVCNNINDYHCLKKLPLMYHNDKSNSMRKYLYEILLTEFKKGNTFLLKEENKKDEKKNIQTDNEE